MEIVSFSFLDKFSWKCHPKGHWSWEKGLDLRIHLVSSASKQQNLGLDKVNRRVGGCGWRREPWHHLTFTDREYEVEAARKA